MAGSKKENIYSLKGLKSVYKFTAGQMFKSKSYVTGFIILVLLMWFMGPLQMASANLNASSAQKSLYDFDEKDLVAINGIIVCNGTDVEIDKESIENDLGDGFEGTYIAVTKDAITYDEELEEFTNSVNVDESLGEDVEAKDTLITVYLTIDYENASYLIDGVVSDNSVISNSALENVLNSISDSFNAKRYEQAGVSSLDIQLAMSGVSTNSSMTSTDYNKIINNENTEEEIFTISYQTAMLMLILISLSVSYIVTVVMEEKSSKLAETILVSVRPLALITGKILAVMTYIFSIIILGTVGSLVSNIVCKEIFDFEYEIQFIDFSLIFSKGPVTVTIILISLICTYLIFAIFSGIMGSTCNKMEDMQTSIQVVSLVNVVVGMVSMFGPQFFSDKIMLVLSIIPPFSCYFAPITYMLGDLPFIAMLASILLQILVVVALAMLCAKVYRSLILSDDRRYKFMDVIKLARTKEEVTNV